jgi:thioesterase-3
MEKTLRSSVKIRFQDCDPFNHLNNSSYIDYFLNAREDYLKDYYNFDIAQLMNVGKIGWMVVLNQISYVAPVVTMETVNIRSHLIGFSDRTLLVEMTMWNTDDTQLKAVFWVKFIHVDLTTKTTLKHSSEMAALFATINESCVQTSFEEWQASIIRDHISKRRATAKN